MSLSARTPAFMASVALHALLLVLVLWFAYENHKKSEQEVAPIFELVAGEGDNFAATEAPAIGVPGGGIKIEIPGPPTPNPSPSPVEATPPAPDDTPVEPESPVQPAPKPKPAPAVPPKTPAKPVSPPKDYKPVDMAKMVDRIADKRAANIEKQVKADQKAAADRAAKEAALKAKTMSKADFDRQNSGKSSPSQSTSKSSGGGTGAVKRIDAEGIAKGVAGGSTSNKTGGAGGTALTRQDIELSDAYISLLIQRLKAAHQKPEGLSDLLQATVKFRLTSSGSVVDVTIVSSSRNNEFDQSVLAAFRRLSLPPPPPHLKTSDYTITFKMKEDA